MVQLQAVSIWALLERSNGGTARDLHGKSASQACRAREMLA